MNGLKIETISHRNAVSLTLHWQPAYPIVSAFMTSSFGWLAEVYPHVEFSHNENI
jgi:hypothetical protein